MIGVSACLCGVNCKYSGGNNENKKVIELFQSEKGVLVCPEQLGGLATPRIPSEIVGGSGEDVLDGKAKVMSKEGKDVTKEFIKGAEETLKMLLMMNITKVILKERSPSCGKDIIYDGTFTGSRKEGNGVTTALLLRKGIHVVTENKLEEL